MFFDQLPEHHHLVWLKHCLPVSLCAVFFFGASEWVLIGHTEHCCEVGRRVFAFSGREGRVRAGCCWVLCNQQQQQQQPAGAFF